MTLRVGNRVVTPDGPGEITDIERWSSGDRYGVRLDKTPFSYPIAFYFKNEISLWMSCLSL